MRYSRCLVLLLGVAIGLGTASCGSLGAARKRGPEEPAKVVGPGPSSSEVDRLPKMEVRRTRIGVDESPEPDGPSASVPVQEQVAPKERRLIPATILVGLESDREAVNVACCREPVRLFNTKSHFDLAGSAVIRAWSNDGNGKASPALFFVQVAALKDQRQAEALAGRLGVALGGSAQAVFDARSDLYKVRVGPFDSRTQADSLKPRLEGMGYRQPFILREANLETVSGFEVRFSEGSESKVVRFTGRRLLVERPSRTVRFGKQEYRGRLLFFVNDRGRINVVNEVRLESYLRGVVPKELGPALYPQLEALKAQAIAARTYTVKNLGEFLAEGYDICSTPRCQVYGGMVAEHSLSDQAIRETAGELLIVPSLGGASGAVIVDAMFSASCGGHTENVGSIFPLKSEPYLRARPCIESGITTLLGNGDSLSELLMEHLDGAAVAELKGSRARLEASLLALARAANVAAPDDRLSSVRVGEVRRFLGSLFDLFLDRRWLDPRSEQGGEYGDLAELRPARERLGRALDALAGLSPNDQFPVEDQTSLVVVMAEALGVLSLDPATFDSWDGFEVVLKLAGGDSLVLQDELSIFVDGGFRLTPNPSLRTFPGDAVQVALVQGMPVALIGSSLDRTAGRPILAKTWRRFRSVGRIRELVGERYPGFVLEGLRPESRGVSGRVERLVMTSRDGGMEVVKGLAIRWILDLPDTWFEMEKARRGGVDGWQFVGRGRGHGVGMCQVGAYGMAVLGANYRDILAHYYSGAEVVPSTEGTEAFPWGCYDGEPEAGSTGVSCQSERDSLLAGASTDSMQ